MTNNCSTDVPYSEDFFKYTSNTEDILITIAGVLCLVNIALYIKDVMLFKASYPTSSRIFLNSCVILGVYPVMTIFYFVSICIPKAYLLCRLCSSVYISVSMYSFINLIIHYFGGKKMLENQLKDETMRLRTFPFCCCCVDPFPVTRKVINTILTLVAQNAFLEIAVSFLALVLWLDGKYGSKFTLYDARLYLSIVALVSSILGLGGLKLMVMTCKSVDESMKIREKSSVLTLALLIHNFQDIIFSFLSQKNIPECNEGLSSEVRGKAWNAMIVILELFLLLLLAIKLYRKPHGEHINLETNETNYSTIETASVEGSYPSLT